MRRRALIVGFALVMASACRTAHLSSSRSAPILLYAGRGTSPGDVAALETVLDRSGLAYSTVDSWGLNWTPESEIERYRLLLFPGGNFESMGRGLTTGATANIRRAVQHGVNYLGICAGAFLAGNSPYNGLNLTSGVAFGFYSAEAQGIRKAAVSIASPGGQTLDQYWEDGPQLSGWGAVVAKYPDETPAVVEGAYGRGWVILSGVHPEAQDGWRGGLTFRTSTGDDNAFAAVLIRAALNRETLPHY